MSDTVRTVSLNIPQYCKAEPLPSHRLRLSDLADGFTSYTKATKTVVENTTSAGLRDKAETQASITLVKDSADLLLAPSGNLVQNLLISESTLATSATIKDALRSFIIDGPESFKDSLPLNIGSFLPIPPFLNEIRPFLDKTTEEIKAQELLSKLSTMIDRSSADSMSSDQSAQISSFLKGLAPEEVALIVRELRTNLPKYGPLLGRFGSRYTKALLELASSNIEIVLGDQSSPIQGNDFRFQVVRSAARNLANAANQGAEALKTTSAK